MLWIVPVISTDTTLVIDSETFLIFVAACLAINLTPWPSILYVMTMSIARGRRAGIYAALGLNLGILVHVLAAAFGVSTILATSATAFAIVRYVGAAYLVYLGLTMIVARRKINDFDDQPALENQPLKTLRESILVDLLNPKIALFFLAFLPQFVKPTSGNTFSQIIVLGSIFIVTGTIVNCIIAVLASKTARKIELDRNRWLQVIPGAILIALGVRLATIER